MNRLIKLIIDNKAVEKAPIRVENKGDESNLYIYDVISAEVDRLRTLGRISPETPFIQAYRLVGDAMVAQRQQMQEKPAPVAVRTQTPVAAVAHSAKAAAAASTSSSPRKATTVVNPLAMSDDDFLKSMENRL